MAKPPRLPNLSDCPSGRTYPRLSESPSRYNRRSPVEGKKRAGAPGKPMSPTRYCISDFNFSKWLCCAHTTQILRCSSSDLWNSSLNSDRSSIVMASSQRRLATRRIKSARLIVHRTPVCCLSSFILLSNSQKRSDGFPSPLKSLTYSLQSLSI